MHVCMDAWIACVHGCMDSLVHEFMDSWMHGCTNAQIQGSKDAQMHGCKDAQIHSGTKPLLINEILDSQMHKFNFLW